MLNAISLRPESLEDRNMLSADPLSVGDCSSADAGDANCDGVFDSADIVQIMQSGEYEDNLVKKNRIKNEQNSSWQEGDFDGDGEFTSHDLVYALQQNQYEERTSDPVSRSPWDVNDDGVFNSTDLVGVMAAGEYEDNEAVFDNDREYKGTRNVRNSNALEGDWDGDLEFTSADIVLAMQSGEYVV